MFSKAIKADAVEKIMKYRTLDDMWFWERWYAETKHWLIRKKYQFSQLRKWIPVIWKQYPWDFHYAIDVFRMKLEELAECLESEHATFVDSEYQASRIRLAIRLMDYVYNDKCLDEVHEEIVKLYGEWHFDFEDYQLDEDDDDTEQYKRLVQKWERDYTKEEIEEIDKHISKLHIQAYERAQKAHRLLWLVIERHIQHWWD